MKLKIKYHCLLFSFCFFAMVLAENSFSQQPATFRIIDNGSVKHVKPYVDGLNEANMENHRLKNTRVTITFKTGVKVELFSASEILKSGKAINLDDYPESFNITRKEPVFALGANNFIIEYHTSGAKHY